MIWRQLLFLAMTIGTLTRAARADDQVASEHESIARMVQRAPPQNRIVHTDYGALSAGFILLGVGYALALSVPVRRNFGDNTGRLAVPVIGPWLSNPSWTWALDGLVQLGGVAFMVDAYANPIVVLGTPEARIQAPMNVRPHLMHLTVRF